MSYKSIFIAVVMLVLSYGLVNAETTVSDAINNTSQDIKTATLKLNKLRRIHSNEKITLFQNINHIQVK